MVNKVKNILILIICFVLSLLFGCSLSCLLDFADFFIDEFLFAFLVCSAREEPSHTLAHCYNRVRCCLTHMHYILIDHVAMFTCRHAIDPYFFFGIVRLQTCV
jgi:hypothetical protein